MRAGARCATGCLLTIAALALAGCQTAPRHDGMAAGREARTVAHPALADALACVRDETFQTAGRRNRPPLAAAVAALGRERPILIAERHDHYEDHLLQLAVLDALHSAGRDVAVGVEWFQHDTQPHLDAYIAGRIEERALLERSRYFQRWGFDYRLYRPIMRYARRKNIPVIALNAPPERVREVSEAGFEALPDGLRQRAGNEPDALPAAYVERLRTVFERHPGGSDFEHFLAVQLFWDETMAVTAADYLRRHPHRQLLILAGRGHVIPGHTIPDRLAAYTGRKPAVVAATDGSDDMGISRVDLALQPPALALPEPGRLGVLLGEAESGVTVQSTQDDSAAAAAGVPKGAVLLSINQRPVNAVADVRLALYGLEPGDTVRLTYRPAADEPARTQRVRLR